MNLRLPLVAVGVFVFVEATSVAFPRAGSANNFPALEAEATADMQPVGGSVLSGTVFDGAAAAPTSQTPAIAPVARQPTHFHHPDSCACCECCTDCCPMWHLDAGAILLWRNDRGPGEDFDVAAGPQFAFGWSPNACSEWEVEYFSVLGMSSEVVPPINTRWTLGYLADLHTIEINYLRKWNQLALIGGFRFLRLNENYQMLYRIPGIPEDDFSGRIKSHTDNDLYGGQIGLRWRQTTDRVTWEYTGKAGVFGNDANGTQSISETDGPYGYNIVGPTGYRSTVAFVGDINISMGYQLNPVWTFKVGYNMLWIHRVALAPDQLINIFNSFPRPTDIGGDLFLHGLNLGFEGHW